LLINLFFAHKIFDSFTVIILLAICYC